MLRQLLQRLGYAHRRQFAQANHHGQKSVRRVRIGGPAMSTPERDLDAHNGHERPVRPDFTATISVDQSPEEAFAAINNVQGWWSENIEGSTASLGDEWTYRYKDAHRSTMKVQKWCPTRTLPGLLWIT